MAKYVDYKYIVYRAHFGDYIVWNLRVSACVVAFLMLTSVVIGLALVPSVQAQSGITTILNLQYPSEVALQGGTAQATVTFTVYYNYYYNPLGGYLLFGVWDAQTSKAIPGSATATLVPCAPAANNAGYAICEVVPNSGSGSESASFALTFNSAQQYNLQAAAAVVDEYGNTVTGSSSHADFTITVTGRTTSTTTTITNLVYPPHATLRNGAAQATVKFTAGYSGLVSGDMLFLGVGAKVAGPFAKGSATSTPDSCFSKMPAQYASFAVCLTFPTSSSGTESTTFNLSLNPDQSILAAAALVTDSSGNLISGSGTYVNFTIALTDKLMLTVNLPSSVAVSIDGANQTAGVVTIPLIPGNHTISVPQTVPLTAGSQLRFDHWWDGSKQASRADNLLDDSNFTAIYVTQYSLSLTDPLASGAGWYDQGATAQFSVPASEPAPGILGMLGATRTFQGWYENGALVTSGSSGSITMNAPHTLSTQGTENDTLPIVIIVVALVAIVAVVYVMRRRRGTAISSPRAVSPSRKAKKGVEFCGNCGAQLAPDNDFCTKCGVRKS